jgi:2-octaprenyl-6-methoxyphenol hydroxylase
MPKAVQEPVIIVGGGPIGSTLALGLAEHQIPSIVIDRVSLEDMATYPDDGRALAIAAGSQELLEHIGLWPSIASAAEPIRKILTINGNEGATLDFTSTPAQPMGHIVEMYRLRRALADKLAEKAGPSEYIQWMAPHTIEKLEVLPHQAIVHLKDGPALQGSVVIAADGRHSTTRALAGIDMTIKDYGQKAIVFTFEHSNAHDGVAYEKFLPTGTFAILPMTKDRSSVVWTVPDALAEELLSLSEEAFDQKFMTYVPDHYTNVKRITPSWSYALAFSLPTGYVKPRFALAGDAAHVVHPLAGQGLNLGFRDVKSLLSIFFEGQQLGLDLGSITLLKRYGDQRRPDHLVLLATTNLLNRLFSNNNKILENFRNLGLSAFNDITPLKHSVIQYAMGTAQEAKKS